MDKTPGSSSCNNNDRVPEETAMETVLSDLHALKKLYGLLQRLDETPRALLKKLLDDATRRALLKQANALTTASDSVTPFSLGSASPKKMDQSTSSSSSFLNNKEAETEQILSDMQVLTRLYMLLHKGAADENLDEASKTLLMKILEDATQEAVRRQAKMLSGSQVSPALERKLSTRSDCQTQHADPRQKPLIPPRPTLLSSEQSRQLNLQHSTVSSRVNGRRHEAEEPPLARLASKLSSRTALPVRRHRPSQEQGHSNLNLSDCQTQHADPRQKPLIPPRQSLLSSEQSRQLNLQHSTVSSRVNGRRHAAEEPPLARLASKLSSRTALPVRRHRPSQEQRNSSLNLHRSLVAGTSQHGTITRGTRLTNRQDSIRRSSAHGDHRSMERSSSSSISRRSMSRELSLEPSSRLHGHATPRHVGTERSSSVSSSETPGSRLSTSMTSRHGMENVGRGLATPECSSSSNTVATIQSRIRPNNSLHMERSLRRSAGKGRTSLKRHTSDVSSANMYSNSVSSGSRSSSSAASLSASTSPTASPTPHAFANPYRYSPPPVTASPKPRAFATPYHYSPPPVTASPKPRAFATPYHYSPPVMAPQGIAPPVYAPKVSRSMRRRRRKEILEKRVTRLRMLKDKIATVIHHLHDHHHHHHLGGAQGAGPSSRSVVRSAAGHLNSPWQSLTSMFHHAKGKAKNIASRAVAAVPEKRRGGGGGGGGNMHTLFDAAWRHFKDKRRAPAGVKLKGKAGRVMAKKMHWWQRLNQRRGGVAGLTAGSKPRRRLGHGKAGWL